MASKKKVIIPYRMGDVVTVKGTKGVYIIDECNMIGPQEFEYSTNTGALHKHSDITLISDAHLGSLEQLFKDTIVED